MKITIVIPMYNEQNIIEDTAKTLSAYMQENFNDYELVFSNDGSKDSSAAVVEALGLPNTRVVGYEVNRGKGCAVRTAALASEGDIIMFTDADLAYGTDVIKRTVDIFEEHPEVDMVFGSRNIGKEGYEGYTLLRKIMSKTYIKLLSVVGGLKLSDSQCGCKAFRKDAAKEIFSKCKVDRFAFDFEIILWADELGKKVFEMPVKIINHRESKVNVIKDTARVLRDLVRIKRSIRKAVKESKK